MWHHREPVMVLHAGKWWKTQIDTSESHMAPYGYVLVAGIPGRAGPFSVAVSEVRKVNS